MLKIGRKHPTCYTVSLVPSSNFFKSGGAYGLKRYFAYIILYYLNLMLSRSFFKTGLEISRVTISTWRKPFEGLVNYAFHFIGANWQVDLSTPD